jgi:hypothetical protein
VVQNFQGIKPIVTNDKLQNGVANIVTLQAGIMCPTENSVEWRNYGFRQGYKDGLKKL